MAIVGVSGSSLKVGAQSGIQKGVAGLGTNAVAGTDFQYPDVCDYEISFLQTQLNIVNPVSTRWKMMETVGARAVSAGSSTAGVPGGIQCVSAAAASSYSWLVPSYSIVVGVGFAIPPLTGATWGMSVRFSTNFANGDSGQAFVGNWTGLSNPDCVFGCYSPVSTANYIFSAGGVWVDTKFAMDGLIHIGRAWRIGGQTYWRLYSSAGVLQASGNAANLFPATGAFSGMVCAGTVAKSITVEGYWNVSVSERVV